jgi:hypothetical protein
MRSGGRTEKLHNRDNTEDKTERKASGNERRIKKDNNRSRSTFPQTSFPARNSSRPAHADATDLEKEKKEAQELASLYHGGLEHHIGGQKDGEREIADAKGQCAGGGVAGGKVEKNLADLAKVRA